MRREKILNQIKQNVNAKNASYILIGIFAACLFWIAAIGLYGKPVLDDIASMVVYNTEGGPIGLVKHHILTTNGRLGDATVTAALYKLFGLGSVPLAGIIAVISLLVGFYVLYRYLLRLRGRYLWLATLGSVVSLYFMLWTPYHDFYWLSVVHGYVIQIPLIALVFIALYNKHHQSPLITILLLMLLFYAGTFNELFTISIMSAIGLWWLIVDRAQIKQIMRHLPAIATLFVSFAFLYLAPGAIARRSSNSAGSGNLGSMLSDSLGDTVRLLTTSFLQPGLLAVLAVGFLLVTWVVHVTKKDFKNMKLISIFFVTLTPILTFETAFIADYTNSAEGGLPARRTFIYFTIALVITLIVGQAYLYGKLTRHLRNAQFMRRYYPLTIPIVSLILLVCFVVFTTPLIKDDSIQLTGRYYLWNQREKSIYDQKLLHDKTPTVESLPIELLSDLMAQGYFYNEFLEKYYGVDSFILINPQSKWSREY